RTQSRHRETFFAILVETGTSGLAPTLDFRHFRERTTKLSLIEYPPILDPRSKSNEKTAADRQGSTPKEMRAVNPRARGKSAGRNLTGQRQELHEWRDRLRVTTKTVRCLCSLTTAQKHPLGQRTKHSEIVAECRRLFAKDLCKSERLTRDH